MTDHHDIPSDVRTRILATLDEIERTEGVRVFYACESGSRAWGFPSADSDYDVRFLYVRSLEHYLSIDVELRPDVIERPIDDELDVSGWDLRKALGLLYKSNPPLLEWLDSPIRYREQSEITEPLRDLVPRFYLPRRAFYHYLSMAGGNYRSYLQSDRVRRKKYFYVLRPLLALRWIEERSAPVPMEFASLLDLLDDPSDVRAAIDAILVEKRSGMENDLGDRIAPIDTYIATELARLEATVDIPDHRNDIEELNRFFRGVVG